MSAWARRCAVEFFYDCLCRVRQRNPAMARRDQPIYSIDRVNSGALMSNDSIIPISDEQAKLARELVAVGRDTGGYLADILGDLPKDLVGLLVGDRVKLLRAERLAKQWGKAKKRLKD